LFARWGRSAVRTSAQLPALSLQTSELTQHCLVIVAQCGVSTHERLEGRVGNPFRMELLLDPFVETGRSHARGIAWSRTEREPVERVNNLLVSGELPISRLLRYERVDREECEKQE
jgi:hypothetical protein